MVTTALQEALLPFISVTVNVTGFVPISLQSKEKDDTEYDAIPHASEDPLSTCDAVIVALPVASRATVIFWQATTGSMSSTTVTFAVQVDVSPFTSVTVSVTGTTAEPELPVIECVPRPVASSIADE